VIYKAVPTQDVAQTVRLPYFYNPTVDQIPCHTLNHIYLNFLSSCFSASILYKFLFYVTKAISECFCFYLIIPGKGKLVPAHDMKAYNYNTGCIKTVILKLCNRWGK